VEWCDLEDREPVRSATEEEFMNCLKATVTLVGLGLLSVLTTGCATLLTRPTQGIPVSSTPTGAHTSLECDGVTTPGGDTPTVIQVQRRAESCVITLSREGFEPQSIALEQKVDPRFWANLGLNGVFVSVLLAADPAVSLGGALLLLGGGTSAPWVIDVMDQRKSRHSPGKVNVLLVPVGGAPSR
jgi:hypothetical protein